MVERECCHKKRQIPWKADKKQKMRNRLSRIEGQIKGILAMLEDERYCGDILNQVVAAEKGLRAFGLELAKSHFYSCVLPDISTGDTELADEFITLFEQLSR